MSEATRLIGIRGATCAAEDTAEEVAAATRELLDEIFSANALVADDVVSILFTGTPDLRAAYPASAARQLGLTDVALMGAQEMDVEGGMPRVIRVLLHAYAPGPPRHVYLREARALRSDLDHL